MGAVWAFGWGVTAASGALVGAILGLITHLWHRSIAALVSLGAGVLLSAASFKVASDALMLAGAVVTTGGIIAHAPLRTSHGHQPLPWCRGGTVRTEARALSGRSQRVDARVVQLQRTIQRGYEPIEAEEEWAAALGAALGTTSTYFVDASVRRLMAASMIPGEIVPTTISLSAALALVESMEPENEVQARSNLGRTVTMVSF
jgi:hypothetical protein